ncbi:hypothetical protein DMC01_10040 [Campylobacter troglodytis]|nr:hypothetical protein DMC01_10040 [Campylobacter troglodytis]
MTSKAFAKPKFFKAKFKANSNLRYFFLTTKCCEFILFKKAKSDKASFKFKLEFTLLITKHYEFLHFKKAKNGFKFKL